jgi:hypothetical protein
MASGKIIVVNRHNTGWMYEHPEAKPVYIGRGTVFGNEASWEQSRGVKVIVKDRAEAIAYYENWVRSRINLKGDPFRKAVIDLAWKYLNGETIALMCSCSPQPCHGDILKRAIEVTAKVLAKETV